MNRQKFECHQVNSQGGCRENERLVMDRNSDCKAGVCVENRADKGQACRDQVVYSGECWEQESEEPCSRQPGTRLAPDLFGGVECKCAFHLGHTLQDGVCQKWGPSLLDIRGLNFLEKEIWRRCSLSADCVNSAVMSPGVSSGNTATGDTRERAGSCGPSPPPGTA